jgi:hypothetical protein
VTNNFEGALLQRTVISGAEPLPHFGNPKYAKFAIDQIEECQHDRTPQLINEAKADPDSFQGYFEGEKKWLREGVGVWDTREGSGFTLPEADAWKPYGLPW